MEYMKECNILGSKRIKRNLITRQKPKAVNTNAMAASKGISEEKWAEERVDIESGEYAHS